MKRREVTKVSNQLHRKLDDAGVDAQRAFDPETIHNFRVTYKKLRAFGRLLNSTNNGSGNFKMPGNLKKFYRSLGAIRDWQLLQKTLLHEKFSTTDTALVKTFIAAQLVRCKRENSDLNAGNIIASSKVWFQKHVCKPVDLVLVELYLDKLWQDIYSTSVNIVNDQQIHTVRKKLKDIYYVTGLVKDEKMLLYANGMEPGMSEQYVANLMKELGEYNDLCISINLLEKEFMPHAEKSGDTCNQVCSVLKQEKEEWRPALIAKIQQSVHADAFSTP